MPSSIARIFSDHERNSLHPELLSIKEELKCATHHHMGKVVSLSDCLKTVNMLNHYKKLQGVATGAVHESRITVDRREENGQTLSQRRVGRENWK